MTTIPFIYLLIIRKTKVPKLSVVPVMIIGMLVGMLSLPSEDQLVLQIFRLYGLPVLELGVVSLIVLKVLSTLKRFKLNKGLEGDFYSTLQKTCQELLPNIAARLVTTEISVIYYSLLSWEAKVLSKNEFSYHRKSGSPALLGGLIFIIAAETFAMHFVFALWSETLAWVLTGLSIYTLFQMFGFMKSLRMRPVSVSAGKITLPYGIMSEAVVNVSDIERVEQSRKSIEDMDAYEKLSPLGSLDSHNLLLHMKSEQEFESLYGRKKKFNVLAIYIDDKEDFLAMVEEQY